MRILLRLFKTIGVLLIVILCAYLPYELGCYLVDYTNTEPIMWFVGFLAMLGGGGAIAVIATWLNWLITGRDSLYD